MRQNSFLRQALIAILILLSSHRIFGQTPDGKLQITQLTGNFYIYTTYNSYKGTQVPANGMYVVTNDGVMLFDTPWDTTQFQPLLDSINYRHHKKVIACIATHFHEDRTGGLEYYQMQGVETFTTRLTDALSARKRGKRAEFLLDNDSVFHVGQYTFQTFYPGPGHAPDNIVIWFPNEKILYGGCLIKSTEATDLGNLSDANVNEWANSLLKIQEKFGKPEYIIPGHNSWNSNKSLEHTLRLIKKQKRK